MLNKNTALTYNCEQLIREKNGYALLILTIFGCKTELCHLDLRKPEN